LIRERYNRMVEYTTALRLGTTETEAMRERAGNRREDHEIGMLSLHLIQYVGNARSTLKHINVNIYKALRY
jgi:hypothetical protein